MATEPATRHPVTTPGNLSGTDAARRPGALPWRAWAAELAGTFFMVAWGLSAGNSDVALGVLQPALGGTWVVTPEMLRGEHPIMYNGPSYEPPRER